MRYWKLMAHYNAETTAYSAAAGALGTSPFRPPEDARMVGVRLIPVRSAVTSLLNGVVIRLTSTSFTPNSFECALNGNGLQTAPCPPQNNVDYECNQPVKSGVDVNVEGINHAEGDTPVTVNVLVMGLFDNGK